VRSLDDILVVNAGSSSLKFEVFAVDGPAKVTRKIKGQIDGIGTRRGCQQVAPTAQASLTANMTSRPFPTCRPRCSQPVLGCGKSSVCRRMPSATASYMAAPSTAICATCAPGPAAQSRADPRHSCTRFPELPQVAASIRRFTAVTVQLHALPQQLHAEGLRRHGFHGLPYKYIAARLPEVAGSRVR
jgi:acetate kinase